jgi:hypothetical protein
MVRGTTILGAIYFDPVHVSSFPNNLRFRYNINACPAGHPIHSINMKKEIKPKKVIILLGPTYGRFLPKQFPIADIANGNNTKMTSYSA